GSAAEKANVRELVEVPQHDDLRFHAAHGETSHGAVRLIRDRSEVGLNVRDRLVHADRFGWLNPKIRQSAGSRVVSHAITPAATERAGFVLGEEVNDDPGGTPLNPPAVCVFAPAVLQI